MDLLTIGQIVKTDSTGIPCKIEQFIGSGGQGEVYRADLGGQPVALKWYYPHYLSTDPGLRQRLEAAIKSGAPNNRFLWPIEIVSAPEIEGFGYVMPLRDPQYKGLVEMMAGRIEPSFRALSTAGFQLADSFHELHSKGHCYRDISFGNVFLNPDNGNVLICDNDNVDIDLQGTGAVSGTPSFMAPEIVRGEAQPSIKTDLFSLAVLLFYIFVVHHPLDGKKEADIRCFDLPARRKLYGTEPVFIYDPNDDSNRPVPGYQDNAIELWPIYPQFLQKLFTKAFTVGLNNPNERIQETEWRQAMIRLRDSIVYCPRCGSENFYDLEFTKASGGKSKPCRSCQAEIQLPPRIRIGKNVVMLNHDAKLFPHHVDTQKLFDFSSAVAEVSQHPTNPNIWGLKNLSSQKWDSTTADGKVKEIEPGRSIVLAVGTKINFGTQSGEIRF